jgi:hypothetical protein
MVTHGLNARGAVLTQGLNAGLIGLLQLLGFSPAEVLVLDSGADFVTFTVAGTAAVPDASTHHKPRNRS